MLTYTETIDVDNPSKIEYRPTKTIIFIEIYPFPPSVLVAIARKEPYEYPVVILGIQAVTRRGRVQSLSDSRRLAKYPWNALLRPYGG